MDQTTNDLVRPTSSAQAGKKLIPSWVVYAVFVLVVLLVLTILLVPLPFSQYLYNLESDTFFWNLGVSPLILAGVIILAYVTFYLLRVFRITAIKPITPGTVPIIERTFLGPLTLWAIMLICAEVTIRVIFRDQADDSIGAALTAAALLFSFPLAFLVQGLITFSLTQTRKRYAIVFFCSVVVIAMMPIILKATAPIVEALPSPIKAQNEKNQQLVDSATSMDDCSKIQEYFSWRACINNQTNSKADYFACLKQAANIVTDKNANVTISDTLGLCDGAYAHYLDIYNGREYEMNGDKLIPHLTGTTLITDCQDLSRYTAWSACVNVSFTSADDFTACTQQAAGRTRTGSKGPATFVCNALEAVVMQDTTPCNLMNGQDKTSCLSAVSAAITNSAPAESCLQQPTSSLQISCLSKRIHVSSDTRTAVCESIRKNMWVDGNSKVAQLTVAWSVTCHETWPSEVPDGVTCSNSAPNSMVCTKNAP